MTDYLVFQLYGPMSSWGEAAVGEYRPTSLKPTRSAILGLVACCLGISRVEEEQLRALDESLSMAVLLERRGTIIRDYHTVQTPQGTRARDMPTRKAELEYKKVGANLTYREYRVDAAYRVALWLDPGASFSLDAIENALRHPVFTPYLGRKSCPLAAPMAPVRRSAEHLAELALSFEQAPLSEVFKDPPDKVVIFWEEGSEGFDDISSTRRNDDVVSRQRWQFKKREERRAEIVRGG